MSPAILHEILRRDLSAFIQRCFAHLNPGTEYLHNWHVDAIADHLIACHRREIKRLIINIPPRYGKSESVSVAWPAWELGHNPSETIVGTSYVDKLAIRDAVRTRRIVTSDWYQAIFPETRIAKDQNEKSKFETTKAGRREAVGMLGSATGTGGRILFVDDPHDPTRALSDARREDALEWLDGTFYSRLDDKKNGVIVVVMQRLHTRDMTGHLLAGTGEHADQWAHLCLPAEAETRTIYDFGRFKNAPVVRAPGTPLHPEREGRKELAAAKERLGAYHYAGQYQQRPVPREGGLIKAGWIQRYRDLPEFRRVIQSWDTAYSTEDGAAYSARVTMGEALDGRIHLVDASRARMPYPKLKAKVRAAALDHPLIGKNGTVLVEPKASGQSLLQEPDLRECLTLIGPKVDGSKEERLERVSEFYEGGKIVHPEAADWLDEYETDLTTAPACACWDWVDATSQAVAWLMRGRGERFATGGRREISLYG